MILPWNVPSSIGMFPAINSPFIYGICHGQWIGLGEILQENPIFNGKNPGFLQIFS